MRLFIIIVLFYIFFLQKEPSGSHVYFRLKVHMKPDQFAAIGIAATGYVIKFTENSNNTIKWIPPVFNVYLLL